MKDVIQKLDIRRRQVYVEAAIIEMSLTKQRELGFELQVPVKSSSLVDNATSVSAVGGTNFGSIGNAIVGGPAALASASGLSVGAVRGTFTFKGQQFLSIGALLHALQTDGDVNVLSTPNILTMDNQKAEIMVGQNVPFVGSQTQTAATAGQIFSQIERKDVGITLKLTPQITSDDNVRLEVYQEISDVIQTAGLNANVVGPTTSKRSASTTVVVKDRQTMVIGGLIRDNVTSGTSKVPFLGDIPLLGWLFKSKTSRIEKTNLMIFITPYIIKNEGEASELTNQKNDTLDKFRKEYRIEKKGGEPSLQPVKPPERTGTTEQPAGGAVQPQAGEQPAPAQQMESSGTTEQPAGEAVQPQAGEQPAPAQQIESSPTATQPPVNSGTPQEGAR
jgi:general secretion pathway protein D